MTNDIFITTTLPYANSVPHVGHTLEFVQADALARYFRSAGHNVRLNVGLDEHGLKIYQAAQTAGVTTKQFVDNISTKWYDFCKTFEISYDNFYRTSSPQHHARVQNYWLDLVEKGDIYKKDYVGKYCVGCEEYKTETQLVDGKCSLHPSLSVQEFAEENWFLKLSRYRDQIREFFEVHPEFIFPASKHNEFEVLLENIEDISVSRKRDLLPWGVEVPNDSTQTIYVWFDALLNYLFACGIHEWDHTNTTIQLCGPDNLKFQALVWQSILLANNYKHTDHILVHGTILDPKGNKMSKTLGNVVDPIEQINKYGIDAVRYYLLKGLTTFQDSSWDEKNLVTLYNADLANNLGNMIARTLHLIDVNNVTISDNEVESAFINQVQEKFRIINSFWKKFEIQQALEESQTLLFFGNKYLDNQKPWSNPDLLLVTLNNMYYLLRVVVGLYKPVLPSACAKIQEALQTKKKVIIFDRIKS